MVKSDSRQAEKDYLALSGSSAWERFKPFSHPGADTLPESAQLLHDFAIAMMTLAPGRDDLILDLGAGGCWCSDLLHRLHRKAVAVDISLDMLRAGRSRPSGAAIRAVAGDVEWLPFASGTFRQAICLNAIHHVRNMPGALREIGRVLTNDGVALFSEPGRGHAHAPASRAAMRDFGVLEQDVLIPTFTRACYDAGFLDIRIKTLSYAIPVFDLTPKEWESWSRLAASKRPARAFRTIARGVAELFGLGKRGPLFEDAFGMRLIRTLRHAMEDHPVIVASKAPLDRPPATVVRSATMELESSDRAERGRPLCVRARIINRGSTAWHATSSSQVGHVRLGVQLLDERGRLIARDYHRVGLPGDVAPAASVEMSFECPTPDMPGEYGLKFDMVAEGETWFEPTGSPVVTRTITVW